ncbi:MAG: DHH family phosphoesterase [Acidilobaceae archaeon]
MPPESLARLEEVLRRSRLVGVATHSNADPDALASLVLAARIASHFGARVCIAVPEGLSKASKRLVAALSLELEESCDSSESLDVCIVVDSSNPAQLGDKASLCLSAGKLVVFDHHKLGELAKRADVAIVDESSPSTTELLVEACSKLGVSIESHVAELALAGILYDSRRFSIATKHSLLAAAKLLDYGCDYGKVVELLRVEKEWVEELSERVAVLKALSRLKLGKACSDILIASTSVGSHESLVAKKLVELGADVALVVVDRGESKRVSVRVSKRALARGVKASDVASYVASKLGGEGGGHEEVAMAHVKSSLDSSEIAEEIASFLPGRIGRICRE